MNLIGRILYGLPMIVFGIFHFVMRAAMASMVPSYVPGGDVWVYITGAGLILAGLAIITHRMMGLAGLLLGIMLLSFVFTIHLPALIGGDQNAMTMVLKDLALAGGAFYLAGTTGRGLFEM